MQTKTSRILLQTAIAPNAPDSKNLVINAQEEEEADGSLVLRSWVG